MKALDRHINHAKTLCFLDLEGTQFSHEMIALGAVKATLRKDGTIRKIHRGFYTLVKPKNRIGKVVTDLTGITEADVKKSGVPFRVAMEKLKKYMGREFTKCYYVTFGTFMGFSFGWIPRWVNSCWSVRFLSRCPSAVTALPRAVL